MDQYYKLAKSLYVKGRYRAAKLALGQSAPQLGGMPPPSQAPVEQAPAAAPGGLPSGGQFKAVPSALQQFPVGHVLADPSTQLSNEKDREGYPLSVVYNGATLYLDKANGVYSTMKAATPAAPAAPSLDAKPGEPGYIDRSTQEGAELAARMMDQAQQAAPQQAAPQQAAPASGTYTVKPGESLSMIARKQLGDGNRWREIYELNKDKIKNPNLIQPGWQLKMPPKAGQQEKSVGTMAPTSTKSILPPSAWR